MDNNKKMLYHDRLRCYEDEKRKIIRDYPDYTAREYEEAVKKLADKWRI